MSNSSDYHIAPFSDATLQWTDTPMHYNASVAPTMNEGCFQSFPWASLDHLDVVYDHPSFRASSKDTMSSLELSAGTDTMSVDGFASYEGDGFSEISQSSPIATMTQKMGHSPRFQEREPDSRTRTERISSSRHDTSKSQDHLTVDTTKRPPLQRRLSEQSATSTPSSTFVGDNKASSNASTANSAHIIAERRYRNNLNAKIDQIRTALQHAQFRSQSKESYRSRGGTYFVAGSRSGNQDSATAAPTTARDRRRKADILDEAAEYIKFADVELRHLTQEVQWLTQALTVAQGRSIQ